MNVNTQIHFVDINEDVVAVFADKFKDMPNVSVIYGNVMKHKEITDFDAIVSPANSLGFMRGGIDGFYSQLFPEVEERVQKLINKKGYGTERKYLPIGAALITRTGSDEIPFIVSAPTMRYPGSYIGKTDNAFLAFGAALRVIKAFNERYDNNKINHVFCPAFGTGVGGISPEDAAEQMFRAYTEN